MPRRLRKLNGELFFLGDTEKKEIIAFANNNKTKKEVAESLGIKPRQLEYLLYEKSDLLVDKKQGAGGGVKPFPDPTPKEIRERCKEIQAKWTAEVEADRRAGTGFRSVDSKLKEEGLRYGVQAYHPINGPEVFKIRE